MMEFSACQQAIHARGIEPSSHVIHACLGEKILTVWESGQLLDRYPFSWSARPPSCIENSLGTPWGLHAIAEKFGADAPQGTVFKARQSSGETWSQRTDAGPGQPALVTTRILRLRGLEPGLNAGDGIDSYQRFIYIHGTNKPERFPENVSAGCLLLLDRHLIRLFDQVPVNSHVLITHNGGRAFLPAQ